MVGGASPPPIPLNPPTPPLPKGGKGGISDKGEGEGGGGTILVVEDDPFSRELVVDLLEAAGYTVFQAEDGIGLLEWVKRERPDLILLDLQLPGVDGFTLARQLKADPVTQGIPLLAMTAYAQPGDRERALEAGCSGYLPKPLDTKGLVRTVARFLGPPSSRGER